MVGKLWKWVILNRESLGICNDENIVSIALVLTKVKNFFKINFYHFIVTQTEDK